MIDTGETASNPYHVALKFCLEQLQDFLSEKDQLEGTTHVVVECRGKKDSAKELLLQDFESAVGLPTSNHA